MNIRGFIHEIGRKLGLDPLIPSHTWDAMIEEEIAGMKLEHGLCECGANVYVSYPAGLPWKATMTVLL